MTTPIVKAFDVRHVNSRLKDCRFGKKDKYILLLLKKDMKYFVNVFLGSNYWTSANPTFEDK